jgi:RNA polymerase sigma factor (sigma-70 family)
MPINFQSLLDGCKTYDRKAQRQMVDHLVPFLLSVCRRYEPIQENANDSVQEALILIFNNIDQYRSDAPYFLGWCKKIAINVCLSKFRKKQLELVHTDTADNAMWSSPDVFSRFGVEEIKNALNRLPENPKLVFNLNVVDGFSHAEIAEMLGIKESSSRTMLVRARTMLQDIILKHEILKNEY